jgi:hypothetical protein
MRKQYHFWPGEGGIDAWDVDLLIGRVAHVPVEEVVLDDLPEIDSEYWFTERERPTVRKVIEHFRLVGAVDPSYPIILGPGNRSWTECTASPEHFSMAVGRSRPSGSGSFRSRIIVDVVLTSFRIEAGRLRTNRHDATSWRSGPQRCHIVAVARHRIR